MRTDVYAQLVGDNYNTRSLGGRKQNSSIRAWINTDNGSKSDCAVTVNASVSGDRSLNGRPRKTCHCCGRKWGHGHLDEEQRNWIEHPDDNMTECPDCGAARQGIDTRTSHFTIKLPDQSDGHCHVEITTPQHEAHKILQIGAMLVTLQGAAQTVEGVAQDKPQLVKDGRVRIKTAAKLLAESEQMLDKELPNVTLPGGVSLAHALACVEMVQNIIHGKRQEN